MADASDERSPVRVLLGVGNPERERRLRDALSGDGMVIVDRCLDAVSLVERAAAMDLDVALASSDLHRLSVTTMAAVREARLPLVLLAEPGAVEKYGGLAHLVPAGAAAEEVAAALREAMARGPVYSGTSSPGGSEDGAKDVAGDGGEDGAGQVVAVVSGKGAPGKTTVAIALAAALGDRGRRVVLLDADLRGGNVGPHLDLDPRRGLLGLAFGGNGASENGRIEEELEEGPGFAVLTGIERPESRSSICTELLTGAVATLRERFEDVVVDAGEAIAGIPSPATDSLLRLADRALVVTCGDLVSLWNARAAVRHLREGLGMAPEAISVILNRREGRGQYDGEEVERALGVPVLAAVPEDRRAARRAIREQLPITAVGGRAARELRALATRLTAVAPAVAGPARRRRWRLPFSRAGVGAR
ncbi:MAG: P-loop NTPase [Dehalococcoidia bacterium]|nr:P-loop NTPase [Dehalococcoidia bacterium]